MILLINYYIDKRSERQAELDRCLQLNLAHPLIDKIVVLHEKNIPIPEHEKILSVETEGRPSYSEFLKIGNSFEGVKILANSDIYFNASLRFAEHIRSGQVFALCRWEHGRRLHFFNRRGSQDVWIWRGEVYVDVAFGLGIRGCDNKIAWCFHDAGYEVQSPSLSIQCIHLHKSNERDYLNTPPIGPPYLYLRYTAIHKPSRRPPIIRNAYEY
jgi:hypothetical protein